MVEESPGMGIHRGGKVATLKRHSLKPSCPKGERPVLLPMAEGRQFTKVVKERKLSRGARG